MIKHTNCYFYIIRTYSKITATCNETSACEHTEFCNVGGTKLDKSKGFCKTGNSAIFIKFRGLLGKIGIYHGNIHFIYCIQ